MAKKSEMELALMNLEWITRHISKVEQYLEERKEQDQYDPKWLAAKCKLTAIIETLLPVVRTIKREVQKQGSPLTADAPTWSTTRTFDQDEIQDKSPLAMQKQWQEQKQKEQQKPTKQPRLNRGRRLKKALLN